MMQPLSNILVLDMTRIVAGPFATQMLGDMGANIIKVERRGEGDDQRRVGPPWIRDATGKDTKDSVYFQAVNRNKRSLTIDFTTGEGADILRDIAAKADVFVENFRTGTLAKYGLGYADLKAINPRLIYCSLTGFGQTGPYADRPGYDLLVQGMGGLMSVTGIADGEPGAGPLRVGIPLADIFSGMNAAFGILAALRHRDETGQGQHLDISLLDSQIAALLFPFAAWFNGGLKIRRTGNHFAGSAPYGVFMAKDAHILIATQNDQEFVRLAAAVGHAEWIDDPRFAKSAVRVSNRLILAEALTEALSHKPRSEWTEILNKAGVSCGPINDLEDIANDPQVAARDLVVSLPHPVAGKVTVAASPVRLSETPAQYRYPPPLAGQHSAELLAETLGLSEDRIAELKARKII